MADSHNTPGSEPKFKIRAPQRFIAGVFFVCVCLFVLWAVRDLSMGTVKFFGPAMFPNVLAVMLGLSGAALIFLSLTHDGEPLQKYHWRGPIVVTVAIVLFALTIRHFGLAVAGFLSLYIAGFASPEGRPRENLIFAVLMTVACIILFRYLLGMVVPVLSIPGTGVDF